MKALLKRIGLGKLIIFSFNMSFLTTIFEDSSSAKVQSILPRISFLKLAVLSVAISTKNRFLSP
jgi:hypothetical protein